MKYVLPFLLALTAFSLAFAAPEDKPKDPPQVAVTVAVSGFHCQACPDELKRDLSKLDGVTEVKAMLNPPVVTADALKEALAKSEFGFTIDFTAPIKTPQKASTTHH